MQGVLHWVAQPSSGVNPLNVEVRLYDKLFLSEVGIALAFLHSYVCLQCIFCSLFYNLWFLPYQNPAELDDWLADLNPHSKVVIPSAYAVPELRNAVVGDTFQFERLGKFFLAAQSMVYALV